MEKVVLITGASSGIGKETAKLFQVKNWKVAATMRAPESAEDLSRIADIECFKMDVTDVASVEEAVAAVLDRFGKIDVLVNNAGYALAGAFEAASADEIEKQFATNVFGLMNVTRAVLPHFRSRNRGVVVNVSSLIGRVSFPFYSLYGASKFAVEGFSESLLYEVEPFNIRVKVVEPGPIKTDFYDRSQVIAEREDLKDYDRPLHRVIVNMKRSGAEAPTGEVVAETIYLAATDDSKRLRYRVNTKGLLTLRRLMPEGLFFQLVKKVILK
jgi:NAD(P)-dependent dehydrogenase (short-subunit alcohol dehydrogenase family)